MNEVTNWINEISQRKAIWYIKRLSGNDTLANETHQAGPYIPKEVLFDVFRVLNRPDIENPDVWFEMYIDSHADFRKVRAIWYNNKFRGGTRNEARITQLGGIGSALLDPENTGALAVFVFLMDDSLQIDSLRVWVCRNDVEEDVIEDKIGPVEPGRWIVLHSEGHEFPGMALRGPCWLTTNEIPSEWIATFPSGLAIIEKAISLRSDAGLSIDKRLLRRRECEYEVFRSLEEAVELPVIKQGFSSVDDFITRAQTILQRRKARAGRSLELHTKTILVEEGFEEGKNFSYNCESEPGKKPDFLFPSEAAYKNTSHTADKLMMLAVKTTCKDRWRQILNEADRISTKHLLTLQEGVSENQFSEMVQANVKLVVPKPLIGKFPKNVQSEILSLEDFISNARILSL